MDLVLIGVDPSMYHTGVCLRSMTAPHRIRTQLIRSRPGVDRIKNLVFVYREFQKILDRLDSAALIIVERYSFASPGNSITKMAEIGSVIRLAAAIRSMPILEMSPMTWKSIALHDHKVKKKEVPSKTMDLYNRHFATQDECEAFLMTESVLQVLRQSDLTSTMKKLYIKVEELLSRKP